MSTFGWTPADHRDDLQQFHQRLDHEDAMKDTVVPADMFDMHAKLMAENALLRRSLTVLTQRIEELEQSSDEMRGNALALLEPMERMAATLRTFYNAPLSISALQPILNLAVELNPDLK